MGEPTAMRRRIISGLALGLILCAIALPFIMYYFLVSGSSDDDLILVTERPLLLNSTEPKAIQNIADSVVATDESRIDSDTAPSTVQFAIIALDFGLDVLASEQISRLPSNVAVAVSPYANISGEILSSKDVYVDVPLEPFNYPANDPGPHTLKVNASSFENMARLGWLLGQYPSARGAFVRSGAYSSQRDLHESFLQNIASREWQLIESGESHFKSTVGSHQVPYHDVQLVLDETAFAETSSSDILDTVAGLAPLGPILIAVIASPVNIQGINDLVAASAQRGYQLTSLSSLLNQSVQNR